jgi:excinuclease ABC subunit A
VQDVLYAALRKAKGKPTEPPGAHQGAHGADQIEDVVMVDQSPIGKTTRSNPASYVGAFDSHPKTVFANSMEAKQRKYTPAPSASTRATAAARPAAATASSTSRCSSCRTSTCAAPTATASASAPRSWSQGRRQIDRRRARADGRPRRSTSSATKPSWWRRLRPLKDVGWTTCASASRCRRSPAARRSASSSPATSPRPANRDRKLFLFDEPTTGLHFDDVAKLLRAFRQLLDAGHSLLVIEHNLDVIAPATGSSTSARRRRCRR